MSKEMNVNFNEKMWDDSSCQIETEYSYQTPIHKPNSTKEFRNTLGTNKGNLKSFTDWIEQVHSESIPSSSESIDVESELNFFVTNYHQKWTSAKVMLDFNARLSIQGKIRKISSRDLLINLLK